MSSMLSTHVRRVAFTGAAAFVAAVAFAGPAAAAGADPSGVVDTGGGRINIRSGPSTSAEVIGTRANSARLTLVCKVKGEKIRGHRRTTEVWIKIKGGGYVSDAYLKRGRTPGTCAKASYKVSGEVPTSRQMHPLGLPDAQTSFVPSATQMRNAKAIMETGQKLGLPPRAWVIAIATSLQESTLRNHGHLGKRNDHDSLGLFQQRPSMGWGTPKQVTDPVYASTKFYNKLTRIANWEELPLYKAAQRVQVSAFPKAYRKWEKQAGEIVLGLYGEGPLATIS
jgi:hypothetical protein